MRNRIWKRCQLLIALGGFGFALGCASEPGPTNASAESLDTNSFTITATNQVATNQFEATSEPLQTVPPAPIKTTPGVSEVIKLVQSGVDDSVILVYIENSDNFGELSTDEVTYLRDIGVDAQLISAMIRRGHALQNPGERQVVDQQVEASTNAVAVAPVSTNQTTIVQAPVAQPPVVAQGSPVAPVPQGAQTVDNAPGTPIVVESDAPAPPQQQTVIVQQPQQQVTVTYFQETLSPYGTWVELPDYGWTWRPTVAVVDPFWWPYRNGGHWLYTDCGWYWQSDYSWGWAPFHYGRWFRHHHYGWMWSPDTVWGPSWVVWRRTPLYCGWAPMPPGSYYRHGPHGFGLYYHDSLADVHFGIGLSYSHYTFIPYRHFNDRDPHHYYLSHGQVANVYNNSTIVNNYFQGPNNVVINKGIDRNHVAALSRNEIKTVAVRDIPAGAGRTIKPDRIEKRGDQAVIYRPNPAAAPASVQTPLVSKSRQEVRSSFAPEGRGVERAQNTPAVSETGRRPALSTAGYKSVAPSSMTPESARVSRSTSQGVPITRVEPSSPGTRVERRTSPGVLENSPASSLPSNPAAPTPAMQPEHWSQSLGYSRANESRQPAISTPQAVQTPSASRLQSSRSSPYTPAFNSARSQASSSSALPMENRTIVPPPSTPAPISRPAQEYRSSPVITSPSSGGISDYSRPTPAFPSRSERLSSPSYTTRAVPQPSMPAAPSVSAPTPSYQRPMVSTPRPSIAPSIPSYSSPSYSAPAPRMATPAPSYSPPAPSISARPGSIGPASVPRSAPSAAPTPSVGSDPRRGERSSNR